MFENQQDSLVETEALLQANQQLRSADQDARVAAVAFETHDSIVITDRTGRILRVNQSFTRLTGYTTEEVIGKTPQILKSGRHGEEFYRQMWRAIRTEGYWQGEVWNKRKDGQIYLQRLTIASVKNEAGETTHYVGDGQDLTSAKRAKADHNAIHAARVVQQSLGVAVAAADRRMPPQVVDRRRRQDGRMREVDRGEEGDHVVGSAVQNDRVGF